MTGVVLGVLIFTARSLAGEEVDAYWSLEMGIGLSGSVERSEGRLYLFKGGTAVRGFHHGGIDTIKLTGLNPKDTNFGKWTKIGSKVIIRWGGGTNPTTLTAKGASYETGRVTWKPVKRVDGLKLNGLFARENPKNDGAQLMLRADGTFAFRNAHRVNQIDLRPVAPNDGSGKYVLRNWTIYLKYDGGQSASMSFELPHTLKSPNEEFVAIAFQNFYRWPGELKLPEVAKVNPRNEAIGGLIYPVPAEWRRVDDPATGATLILPVAVEPGQLCVLTFPKPEASTAPAGALHKSFWGPITKGMDRVSGADEETVGLFTRSWAVLNRPDGGRIWIALYTLLREGKTITAMFAANREELFFKPFSVVEELMRKTVPRG